MAIRKAARPTTAIPPSSKIQFHFTPPSRAESRTSTLWNDEARIRTKPRMNNIPTIAGHRCRSEHRATQSSAASEPAHAIATARMNATWSTRRFPYKSHAEIRSRPICVTRLWRSSCLLIPSATIRLARISQKTDGRECGRRVPSGKGSRQAAP